MRTVLSARALLLDPQDRVLLMQLAAGRITLPQAGAASSFWVTPGGSLDAGESFEDALRREIYEETGLALAHAGHWVWIGEKQIVRNGEPLLTIAHVFAQRIDAFEPRPLRLSDEELGSFRALRWWTTNEIENSRERFVPRRLAELLTPLLRGEWPAEPLRIEV